MDGNKTEPSKYIPPNLNNKFMPTKISDQSNKNSNMKSNQNQEATEQPPHPIQYNAFNFGTRKQNQKNRPQQRSNRYKNFEEDEEFKPLNDYRPKPAKPEPPLNPQPREFNPNYVPKLQPTEIIPNEKITHQSINPALIVQKK